MDFLDKIEALICAQKQSGLPAAEVLAQMGTPSTSIAILDHGAISARTLSIVGNDTETVFQACSISKPITALAIMKMVQAGALRLDASITEYLPTASLELITTLATRELVGRITIKQLMSHTSGLSQHGFAGYSGEVPNLQKILSGAPPANHRQVHLWGLPGDEFAYSGGGIMVLQLIMETVSNKPFADLMHELVLEPLGMERSFYTLKKGENHASAYTTGYTPCAPSYHVLPEQAAAGLWTTPSDLLKAVRAVQQSLKNRDDSTFLTEALAREMLTEVSSSMALSWVAPKDPGTSFQHGGSNFPGWACFVLGYADLNDNGTLPTGSEDSGICVMTNSCVGEFVYHKIICAIAYLKGWADTSAKGALEVIVPFHTLDEVNKNCGNWRGTWGIDWEISERDGLPALSFQHLPAIRLLPAAYPKPASKAEESIDLVAEGLEIMLRLTEEGGKKYVHIWHGTTSKKLSLQQITKY